MLRFYCKNASADKQSSFDSLSLTVETVAFSALRNQADTFDLLLFKNKTFMSRLQRFVTNSNYDHVGMVLRSSHNELFLFECTSTYGVSVYTLDSFTRVNCKKYYERICYRKLGGHRTCQQIVALERFVKESIGKRYLFDPSYLLRSKGKSLEQEQTYFCSDLVAKALQEAGLLTLKHHSFQFLPSILCGEIRALLRRA